MFAFGFQEDITYFTKVIHFTIIVLLTTINFSHRLNKMNINTTLLEDYVNFVDTTKKVNILK